MNPARSGRAAAAACILGTAMILGACSSSGGSTASTSASAPAAGGTGTTITVGETEFALALDTKTVAPGPVTFDVTNKGRITHALTIDGPGVEDKSTDSIDPGKSATLTVTLARGTYDVYCPVGDHKMEGMDTTITVS